MVAAVFFILKTALFEMKLAASTWLWRSLAVVRYFIIAVFSFYYFSFLHSLVAREIGNTNKNEQRATSKDERRRWTQNEAHVINYKEGEDEGERRGRPAILKRSLRYALRL